MKRLLLITAALVLGLVPATAASASPAPTHQVSPPGQYLYEFEALLKHSIGVDNAVGRGDYLLICGAIRPANLCHFGWFYKQLNNVPNGDLTVYTFTFSNFGRSSLHLAPSWLTVKSWGNRTAPVTINGRLISCNAGNTEFLVGNAQALGAGPSGAYEPSLPGGGIMVNGGGWNCGTP